MDFVSDRRTQLIADLLLLTQGVPGQIVRFGSFVVRLDCVLLAFSDFLLQLVDLSAGLARDVTDRVRLMAVLLGSFARLRQSQRSLAVQQVVGRRDLSERFLDYVLGIGDAPVRHGQLAIRATLQCVRFGDQLMYFAQAFLQVSDAFDERAISAASSGPGVFGEDVDFLLNGLQFPLELGVIDDGRILLDLAQHAVQLGKLAAVVVGGVLHQVVAVRAVQAALMAVELVLLAPVAPTALDVVVARALAELVALEPFRAALVAVAGLASLRREAVLVGSALVAAESEKGSSVSRFAPRNLSCVDIYPSTPGLQ